MNNILIIIPAYNEAKTIRNVIREIRNNFDKADILVINDCSKDETEDILIEEKIEYIDLVNNLGIGGAMQTGYIYAYKNNYDIAIQIDADGQHDPRNIKDILKPIEEDKADMVIGSRYVEKTLYRAGSIRRIGMLFFQHLISLIINQKISDTTSGYRAINKEIIKLFAKDYPIDYPEVEVIVKLNKKGFRIVEVPVQMHARKEGVSSITPIKSIYYMIKVTFNLMKRAVE